MADPVSWFLIEPGWRVVGSDAEEIGRVDEAIGDDGADLFHGLAVATGLLGRPRYVPAEQVAAIYDGEVQLTFPAAEASNLREYEARP